MPLLDLPPIPAPTLAVAQFQQTSVSEKTRIPRQMTALRSGESMQQRPVLSAAARTCGGAGDLYDAFMATRFPEFCVDPTHVALLAGAERAEILACASRDYAESGPDDSLPPRGVAITLLIRGACAASVAGHRVLDALAHLAAMPAALCSPCATAAPATAPPLASLVRFAVTAGADAEWYASEVAGEPVRLDARLDARMQIVVRWAEDRGGWEPVVRSELLEYDASGASGSALAALQTAIVRAGEAFGFSLPDILASDLGAVPLDAWHLLQRRAALQFFERTEGTPSVTLNPPEVVLTPMQMHVRIWPRAHGSEGANEPGAFHAIMLCPFEHSSELMQRCGADFSHGLPADPQCEDVRRLRLHTCGVQAEGFPLRRDATLYARSSTPGKPLREPGSYVWRFEAAIVPYAQIAPHFFVVPCTQQSMMPGDARLGAAFIAAFHRALALGTRTFSNRNDAADALAPLRPKRPAEGDAADDARQAWAASALGVLPSTRRAAIGDVYAWLRQQRAPAELVAFARQAALRFGVDVPLLDVYRRTSELLSGADEAAAAAAARRAIERERRVADAALGVAADEHARRSAQLGATALFSAARFDALLAASDRNPSFGRGVPVLQSLLADGSGVRKHVCDGMVDALADATDPNNWLEVDDDDRALAACAALQVRASGAMAMVTTALIHLRSNHCLERPVMPCVWVVELAPSGSGALHVGVTHIGVYGTCAASTPGALVGEAGAEDVVLVVKRAAEAASPAAHALDRLYVVSSAASAG